MKTKLLLELEYRMEGFINTNCEEDDWPDGCVYEDLHVDMAKAAGAVFDANFRGQEFAENNEIK